MVSAEGITFSCNQDCPLLHYCQKQEADLVDMQYKASALAQLHCAVADGTVQSYLEDMLEASNGDQAYIEHLRTTIAIVSTKSYREIQERLAFYNHSFIAAENDRAHLSTISSAIGQNCLGPRIDSVSRDNHTTVVMLGCGDQELVVAIDSYSARH